MKRTPKSSSPDIDRESLEQIAYLFRAFSDATRLQLLQALREKPKNVGELVEELNLNQANVSKHLQTLFDGKIVTREKRGTASYYSIDDEFIYPLCNMICDKINRDRQVNATTSLAFGDYSI